MGLKSLDQEKIAKMSLIDLTRLIMLEEKKEMKFKEAFTKVADLKGLDEATRNEKISQYYTDLNIDGNFISNGSNMWGLKAWLKDKPVEKVTRTVTKRRQKKKPNNRGDVVDDLDLLDSNIDEYSLDYEEDIEYDVDEEFDETFDLEEEVK